MRRNVVMLPLIWLWVIAVMLACKSDEINPVDKLMGLYQGTFPKGVIIMNTLNNVRLKKNGDFVHFTAYDVLFQKIRIPTTGGFEDRYKDFDYPNCKIVFLYTNSPTQPFATIINTDNSVELGKFSTVTEYSYPDGVKTDYYQLEMDFFVTDTVRLSRTRFKWID